MSRKHKHKNLAYQPLKPTTKVTNQPVDSNNPITGVQTIQTVFSGPLPPPEVLEKYNTILPGAAERILRMAEIQSEHRQGLEKRVIGSDIKRSFWGSIFAFIFGMSLIGLGAALLLMGRDISGFVSLGIAMAPIMTAFIYGSRARKKERIEKSVRE
jgi:uncharacterized membrane protein